MKRFVIVTHEPIADRLSGPAIRVIETARALSDEVAVCIASPYPITRVLPPRVAGAVYEFGNTRSLQTIVTGADAILIQGFTLYKFPFLADLETPLVVDLYCPFQLENMERMRLVDASDDDRATVSAVDLKVLAGQLRRGDFFICANERQRDLWTGMLMALGRVSPSLYKQDPELRHLIDVVPFGVPVEAPVHSTESFRSTIPGVGPEDPLIVWGGSVLEWQDPVTVVDAMAHVVRDVRKARLVFPGSQHPNPEIPPMPVVERTRARARGLGLLDTHVFFTPWVPYDRRADYLLEASIGISAHRMSLETRYAWRTRMLDYAWAALPIVCSTGDAFGDLVATRRLGSAVTPGDATAMARAIVKLLTDPEEAAACRAELTKLRTELEWGTVVGPLRRFIREPRRQVSIERVEKAPVLSAHARTSVPGTPFDVIRPALRRLRRLLDGVRCV